MAIRTISDSGGNWNAPSSWVEGIVPTSSDDVVATATSGNLTITTTAYCKSADFTSYVGTLTHNSGYIWYIYGSLKFVSAMTYTSSINSQLYFYGETGSSNTIETAGKLLGGTTVSGIDSTPIWTLQDDFTGISGIILTFSKGILNTNGKTLLLGNFSSSNSYTRTLNLGASQITCTSSSGGWNCTTSTNLTVNAGTSVIILTGINATFNGGGKTYYEVQNNGAGNKNIQQANTFTNLIINSTAVKTDTVSFNANQTITGTLTLAGNSTINRLLVSSEYTGRSRTLTCNGTINASNVDFMDITGAGSASWDLSVISGLSGDCGGNSGITFTSSIDQHWQNANGGNWSLASNWTSRVPLPQDDVYIDKAFGTSKSVTIDMPRAGKNLDFSGATWTTRLTFSIFSFPTFYGSFILINNLYCTGNPMYLSGRGNHVIDIKNTTMSNLLIGIYAYDGTYTLTNHLTCGQGFTVYFGTFDADIYNVNTGYFLAGVSSTIYMGSGTWNITGTSGTTWNVSIGTLLYCETSTIVFSHFHSYSDKRFYGRGKTYNNITIDAGITGSIISIYDSNTFNNFTINKPNTIQFEESKTQTISGTFTATGDASNIITIKSTQLGTQATLSKSSGTVNCDYLSLRDNNVAGGATWYAGDYSTFISNVTGWSIDYLFLASDLSVTSVLEIPTIYYVGCTVFIDSEQVLSFTLEVPNVNYDYKISLNDVLSITSTLIKPHITTGVGGTEDIGLRIYDGVTNIKVSCVYNLDESGTSYKLRIKETDDVYGIVLVETNDPLASKIRIYDGVSVKAIKKFV